MSFSKCLALSSLLSVTTSAVFAADLPTLAQPAPASGWTVTVGLGPQVQSAFPGARAVTVWPTGTLALRRPGEPEPFSSPDDGFGISLLDYGWIKAGPVGRVMPNRGLSNGNGAFYGLPNVDWTLELGIFGELWYTEHFRARGEIRQGVNGHDGIDANIAFDAIQKWNGFTLALGPRLQLGDTQFMNAYFSVTPYQALLNGKVTPYQAYGGLTSVGVLGSIKYDFTPTWSATVFGGYNRLVSSAAASPVPNNLGSLNQYTGGLIVAHSFNLDLPFLPVGN
ncbi:conserved exported hypothetical protein [Methylocella tundrae]|uniref:MltA-interacting MipA family protein n=1 Tax=Methylocella tundrae TaxID=227605 RepID=A0A8B6M2F8_METTU|nr:MipA/OmpV family protein [Methylocella tundrae]VTZ49197.1 conserved exported hypothetical protein [Methylocella tundrae]